MEHQQMRVLGIAYLSPPLVANAMHLPLSGLDRDSNVHNIAFRTLRFYPPQDPSTSVDPFTVLPGAFTAALGLFPQLAGILRDGHIVSDGACPVPLVLAESDLAVAQVDTDSAGSALLDGLAPPVDSNGTLLALQATRFASGGIALGMRLAHALCDGAGSTRFLTAAALFAQGRHPDVAPVWKRNELLGPRRPPRVVKPFGHVLKLVNATTVSSEQQQQLARECFHVSDARVEALRKRLADEANLKLTTFEVVVAFIWRAKVRASGRRSDEVVKMVFSMNISKLVEPPLPHGYWGNVCVPVYIALAADQLIDGPLAATAALIRSSKQEVDDEYVRSYIDFLELHRGKGVTEVSAFTDWRRLSHSEVDFGWGGLDMVMPLSWRLLGSTEPCFLHPYGAADERRGLGFKVFVALPHKALPGFRREMEELQSFVSPSKI